MYTVWIPHVDFFFNIYNLIKKNSPQELSVKTLIYRLHEYICSLIKPQKYIRIYNAVSYDPTWMNGLRLLVVVFIEIFNFWIHTIGWLDHGLVFLQGFLVFDLFLNTSFFLLPFTNDDTKYKLYDNKRKKLPKIKPQTIVNSYMKFLSLKFKNYYRYMNYKMQMR